MSSTQRNENYTELGYYSKKRLEKQLQEIMEMFLSQREVGELIREFLSEIADAKTEVERRIIEKLVVGNRFTGYYDDHQYNPVCSYDKHNKKAVHDAAKQYLEYAKKIPFGKDDTATHEEIYDQRIAAILTSLFKDSRNSEDYITRLVNRRIDTLDPGLRNEKDTTRLLVFKQALKALDFPRSNHFSDELKEHIFKITGTDANSSDEDIRKAICSLTDNSKKSVTNVFSKLDEMEKAIELEGKDYNAAVTEYNNFKEKEYNPTKEKYTAMLSDFKKREKPLDKEIEKLRQKADANTKDIKSLTDSNKRYREILDNTKNQNKFKSTVKRITENEKTITAKQNELQEQTDALKALEEERTLIKDGLNDNAASYVELKKLYEKLLVAELKIREYEKADKKILASIAKIEKKLKGDIDEKERKKQQKTIDKKQASRDALRTTANIDKVKEEIKNLKKNIAKKEKSCSNDLIVIKARLDYLTNKKGSLADERDRLKNEPKDLQSELAKIYAPLMWADEIAHGYFNDQQTTRTKLYWFAIIFEMTFFSGAEDEIESDETDIQKNLFFDFYADNLLNNLLIEDSEEFKRIEKEPTGHGINYKNYAEAIYLYYISRTDMTPSEKLTNATDMINRCSTPDENYLEGQKKHADKNTRYYESELENLLSIDANDKDALYRYIRENYILAAKSGTNPTHLASGNKTAGEVYNSMLNALKKLAGIIDECQRLGKDDKKENKSEYTSDSARQAVELSHLLGDTLKLINDKSLTNMLTRIEERFYCVHRKKTTDECIDSTFLPKGNPEEDVSRTRIIILYYFWFGLTYISEGTDVSDFKSFYDAFCENEEMKVYTKQNQRTYYMGVNDCLKAAGYQEINPKNIFDITVLFLAFKKISELTNDNYGY